MKIDAGQLTKVAQLARLELSDEEKEEFSKQLSDVMDYVEKIKSLDTDSVEPTDHIAGLKNIFREDVPKESLDREKLSEIAPEFGKGHFIVPKVIES
ncbi:MAG: Asp-tRNA(Asn)/Glu-tRNA(Gln) amidotransferase subunit GatC [Spirochaetaceae bacterium]|jgi:aspartyl-tRNA(Asn)/glutamyl-tRNA(Gln) amidotransferase subunit C|nr:Asp-tRNA(Asn)/Glu-tRNA(Gln) amidotransferase subunit GatC [Spirochaetaceae bacterium]